MPRLEIALLGPPRSKSMAARSKPTGVKRSRSLAYLAVTGKSHTRDHLAGLLWPDYEQDSAYAYLRRTLWELNQMWGKGWVEADRERAGLVPTLDLWLDTTKFEELPPASQAGIDACSDAVRLYRGDFLSGFDVADTAPFEDWHRHRPNISGVSWPEPSKTSWRPTPGQEITHPLCLMPAAGWRSTPSMKPPPPHYEPTGRDGRSVRVYPPVRNLPPYPENELAIGPQPETTALYEAILHGDIWEA